jgi:HK97 family phage major capsid protein
MNIKEQIAKLRKKLEVMIEKRNELNDTAMGESRTLTEEEAKQYDDAVGEIKGYKVELKRLEDLQAEQEAEAAEDEARTVAAAKAVDGSSSDAAAASRGSNVRIETVKEEKGIGFAKFARCLVTAKMQGESRIQVAKNFYPNDQRIQNVVKASVAAGTTGAGTWVGNLVGDESAVFADFVEYLRPMTILGKFGQGGVPSLRAVPFRVPLVGQSSGGAGYWVGEGKAKPLTKFDFTRTTLEPLKVANIAVLSEEAIMYSSPGADILVRDALAGALQERLDIDFIDPSKAASAGVSPASITNGLTPISATGTGTADDVRADLRALYQNFIAANNTPSSAVLIMNGTTALALSLMTNALGQGEFPTVNMTGGTLNGVPVIVSEHIPTDSSGSIVIMANAGDIYLGDEGGVMIDMSREASLEMSDAPTGDATAGTGSSLVSLWQTNCVGIRAERFINWSKRRATAVAYLSGVNWGA